MQVFSKYFEKKTPLFTYLYTVSIEEDETHTHIHLHQWSNTILHQQLFLAFRQSAIRENALGKNEKR